MDGFMAWTSQGMEERGARALEWASLAQNLVGGAGEYLDTRPDLKAAFRRSIAREMNMTPEEKQAREATWKPYIDAANEREAEHKREQEEGRNFSKREGVKGINALAQGLTTAVGLIPGMQPVAAVGEMIRKKTLGFGEGKPLLRRKRRGGAKSYADMTIEERRHAQETSLQENVTKAKKDLAANPLPPPPPPPATLPPRHGVRGLIDVVGTLFKKAAPPPPPPVNPRATAVSNAEKSLKTAQDANALYAKKNAMRGLGMAEEALRKKLREDAEKTRKAFHILSPEEQNRQAQQQALQSEGHAAQVAVLSPTAGSGHQCGCGGAMPSIGFLRRVLKNYDAHR